MHARFVIICVEHNLYKVIGMGSDPSKTIVKHKLSQRERD
jgi:hypothetical protein